jgi:hypothetical protein
MIVGFSTHGTGGGRGPVNYLTSSMNPDRTPRIPPPVVLRGNPELVRRLIDSLAFKRKYTSGVLSFAEPPEAITPEMCERIMDDFERVAFAGLEKDQYAMLWTRHTHAGRMELNFLVPRVELSTGKSLNIHPPGRASKALFDTFRSQVNAEYGLADPDDPARARDVSLSNHLAKLKADASRKGKALKEDIRETITAFIRREIDARRISDRAGVEAYLKGQGFALARSGADYVTILEPGTGERVRLKGGVYSPDNFNPRHTAGPQVRYGIPDPPRATEIAAKLDRLAAARARYHQDRYGIPDHGDISLPELDPHAPVTHRRQRRQRMQRAVKAIDQGHGMEAP